MCVVLKLEVSWLRLLEEEAKVVSLLTINLRVDLVDWVVFLVVKIKLVDVIWAVVDVELEYMNWVVVKVVGVVLVVVVDVVVNDLLVNVLVAKLLVLFNSPAISKLTDPEEIPLEICFLISKYN